MAFPPGFLDELRSRVALGDLVGRRVRLTPRGREQAGLCPFHYEAQWWAPSGARARDYLTAGGLDEETIRRFRLGWAGDDRQALRRALAKEFPEPLLHEAGLLRSPEDGGNPYDYFRGRVMFPIGDRARRVIAFGARTLGHDQPQCP